MGGDHTGVIPEIIKEFKRLQRMYLQPFFVQEFGKCGNMEKMIEEMRN